MQNYTVCYPRCSTSNVAVNGIAGNMPPFQGQLSSANYQPIQMMHNSQNFTCAYLNGFAVDVYTDLNEGLSNSWNNPLCILSSNNQCNVHLCPVSSVVPVSPAPSMGQYKISCYNLIKALRGDVYWIWEKMAIFEPNLSGLTGTAKHNGDHRKRAIY
uniref:Uncharacterized protein n=1 Tax=Glossina pallidipes TaxID=7398 RepID=A0A1A9ZRM8_GLOPL